MSYDAWHPAPDIFDRPSIRTFNDWLLELTEDEYIDILYGAWTEEELQDIEFKLAKTTLRERDPITDIEKQVYSFLTEYYRANIYDDEFYIW